MKKTITIVGTILLGIISFLVFSDYGKTAYPNEYYNVYLEGSLLGTINSKEELEQYIDEVTSHYINVKQTTNTYYLYDEAGNENSETAEKIKTALSVEYGEDSRGKFAKIVEEKGDYVKTVYTPSGLKIEKVLTYQGNVESVEEIYKKIQAKKPFTIKGFQFTIKHGEESRYIYVVDQTIFKQAVDALIETYVGEKTYQQYLDNTQSPIQTIGTKIENIYIEEEITVKDKQIPTDATIYTDYRQLAQFLLFGNEPQTKTYIVKENEMINDIALENKISVNEFLISNPNFKNSDRLIKPGTEVNIKETNPRLSVVAEQYVVEDLVSDYKTSYKYDSSKNIGYVEVIQKGENGLERVSQRVKSVNGGIVFIEPKGKEVLKPSIEKIILKGDRRVHNIGDLTNWGWPSESGWTISDDYEWRIHPITGVRHLHSGIDIAGTGYNSDIYATNNGTVVTATYRYDYGNYVVIDHNNGYYTLYGHMSKIAKGITVGTVVNRGQILGYVGSTGYSTGPHIHYEVWYNCRFCRISPWSLYR